MGIVFTVIVVILLFILLILLDKDNTTGAFGIGFVCTLSMALVGVCLPFGAHERGYEWGQTDALNGGWSYEKHYVYPKGDTIPCDTLYVKIEE